MKTLQERFDSLYCPEPNTGCWLWTGTCNRGGYGQMHVGSRTDGTRKMMPAHHVSFLLTHGRWPSPQLLHRCDTPACVNPEHVREGTQRENVDDMFAKGRRSYGTHCVRGHEKTPENVSILASGVRQCKPCRRIYAAKRKAGAYWESI